VLRGLLDESRDGLLLLDEHGAIVEANAAAATMLGHERSGLVGKPLAAMVGLDDRRRFRRELGRLGAGEPVVLELRLLHGDESCGISLHALTATVPRRVAVAISLERPRPPAPPRPRASERLQSFVLRFPYPVIAFRRDLRVAFANGHARTLFGRDAVQPGTVFGESVPPELRAFATRLVQLPAPLRPTELQLEDGRVLRLSGLAAKADEPAVLFVEDVSDRHRQERVMREFLRNAAHQLRTPVAGITAAIETLQAGAKENPDDRDRFLAHVERHAERLTRVARGLLLLARAQAGESAPVDFVELRPLLDRLVRETEPRDGVKLLTDCAPGLAALATPDLLHEALAALLDNALVHTREGEVRISAAQTNGRVVLTVSDQGPGILPEFVDRVFEPFFRLGQSGEGYGLGLAIAAQAVETMGGEIDVSSSVGSGTSFVVKLPSATVVR
jgi:signal transduction histidine kinase